MKDLMDELGLVDERDNIIVMTDEDGNDVEMEWVDTIHDNGNIYVIMLPVESDDEGDEVTILRMDIDEDGESLNSIEDEKELERVYELFMEKNKDNFDFAT